MLPLQRRSAALSSREAIAAAEGLYDGQPVAIASAGWWCALTDATGNVCCYVLDGGFPFEGFRHGAPIERLKASCDGTRLGFIDLNGDAFVYCLGTSLCHRQVATHCIPSLPRR